MTKQDQPVPSAEQRPKYFLDTEFIESGSARPLELLSIGIVAEDGREFYAVNDEADLLHANDWVKQNVLPHLGLPRLKRHQIASSIIGFVAHEKPEFWGYYADYDWVVFAQLFGAMIDLPKGWPMYCRDLKQLCDAVGNPALPKQTSTEHNALHDARWNRVAFDFLLSHAQLCASAAAEAERERCLVIVARETAGGAYCRAIGRDIERAIRTERK